jgi:hypothetical protein
MHEVVGHSVGQSKGSEDTGGSSIGPAWIGSIISSSSSLATGSGGSTIVPSEVLGSDTKGITVGPGVGSVGIPVISAVEGMSEGDGSEGMSGMEGTVDGEEVGPTTRPSFESSSSADPVVSGSSAGSIVGSDVGSSVGASFGASSSDAPGGNR